jgi:hypothetical protein
MDWSGHAPPHRRVMLASIMLPDALFPGGRRRKGDLMRHSRDAKVTARRRRAQKRTAPAFGRRRHQNAEIDHAAVTRREPTAARTRCPRTNPGGLDQQADGLAMSTRTGVLLGSPDGDCGLTGLQDHHKRGGPASHGAVRSPASPNWVTAIGRTHGPAKARQDVTARP